MTAPTPAATGPACVARQIVVDAEPHEIFALLVDPHRHHEVDGSGTVRPDVIGPHTLEQGDRFRVSMKMFGIPYAMTSTVTRLTADRLIEWRLPFGHRWRWELEDLGDGRTRVTEAFDYSGARVPKGLELVKAPERNAMGIDASLRRLRERFVRA